MTFSLSLYRSCLGFLICEMKWLKQSKWCPQYKWGLLLWGSFLLCWEVLIIAIIFFSIFIYLVVLGLRRVMPDPSFGRADPQTVTHRLSCLASCWILVPWPGIEPESLALQGRFLNTGPGKVCKLPLESLLCSWRPSSCSASPPTSSFLLFTWSLPSILPSCQEALSSSSHECSRFSSFLTTYVLGLCLL